MTPVPIDGIQVEVIVAIEVDGVVNLAQCLFQGLHRVHVAILPIGFVCLLSADGANAGIQADACVDALGILSAVFTFVAADAGVVFAENVIGAGVEIDDDVAYGVNIAIQGLDIRLAEQRVAYSGVEEEIGSHHVAESLERRVIRGIPDFDGAIGALEFEIHSAIFLCIPHQRKYFTAACGQAAAVLHLDVGKDAVAQIHGAGHGYHLIVLIDGVDRAAFDMQSALGLHGGHRQAARAAGTGIVNLQGTRRLHSKGLGELVAVQIQLDIPAPVERIQVEVIVAIEVDGVVSIAHGVLQGLPRDHVAANLIGLIDLLLADGADAGIQADAGIHIIAILSAVVADVAAGALAGSIGEIMGRVGNHHKIFGGGIHRAVNELRGVGVLLGKGRAGGQAGQQGLLRCCRQAAVDYRAHVQGQGAAVYIDGGAIDGHVAIQGQDAAKHRDGHRDGSAIRQLAVAHGHVAGGNNNRSTGSVRQQLAAAQVEGHAAGDGNGAGHGIFLSQQGDGAALGIGDLDGLGQGGMIGGDAVYAQAGHNASAAFAHAVGIRFMLMGEHIEG